MPSLWFRALRNDRTGLVLSVPAGSLNPGAPVQAVAADRANDDGQLWAWDGQHLVHRATGFVLTTPAGAGPRIALAVSPKVDGASSQLFTQQPDGSIRSVLGGWAVQPAAEGAGAVDNESPGATDRQGWTPVPSFPMDAVLRQRPEAFPLWENDADGKKIKAFRKISQELGAGDDLRAQYTNDGFVLSDARTDLTRLARPDDISQNDWDTVVAQLLDEMEAANRVRTVFADFQGFFTLLFVQESARFQSLQALVQADASRTISGDPVGFLSEVAGVAFELLDLSGAGVVANALALAASAAVEKKGDRVADFNVALSRLWDRLSDAFSATGEALDKAEEEILRDWGKLRATSALIVSTGPDSLAWPVGRAAQMRDQLLPAFDRAVLQALLPLAFEIQRWTLPSDPVGVLRGIPEQARYVQALSDGSQVIWALRGKNGTWPSVELMARVTGAGIDPAALLTNRGGWKFDVEEQNSIITREFVITTIANSTAQDLTVEPVNEDGILRGGTQTLPAWGSMAVFLAETNLSKSKVRYDLKDAAGRTVGSFRVKLDLAFVQGKTPELLDVSPPAGFEIAEGEHHNSQVSPSRFANIEVDVRPPLP